MKDDTFYPKAIYVVIEIIHLNAPLKFFQLLEIICLGTVKLFDI